MTSCTEASLRAAMSGGGTVTFACDGTIGLTNTISINTKTVLDASGHQVTISGNNAVRVFYVGAGGDLTLSNLEIAAGRVVGAGVPFYSVAPGESVAGGAIENQGVLNLVNCTFTNNSVVGGKGGGVLYFAAGGAGGSGTGGAVWNAGSLLASGCTFAGNSATGGRGGPGGCGSYKTPDATVGYPGGPGGDAAGGALFNSGTARLVNCTLAWNTGRGGAGGIGGPDFSPNPDYPDPPRGPDGTAGLVVGGGIDDASGKCYLTNCMVVWNSGTGIWTTGTDGTKLINTLLSENLISENSLGGNGAGAITDLGHNLSSDGSCLFTAAGSMNNTDPKLSPLADNGGPTWTMALLPGSPAIDAGSAVGAPATDQRGVPRPQGAGVDIGAFEYLVSPVFMGMTIPSATNRQMQLCGLTPNPTLTLQISTNLLDWQDATNLTAGPNGAFQCVDPVPGDAAARFYRLKSGTP